MLRRSVGWDVGISRLRAAPCLHMATASESEASAANAVPDDMDLTALQKMDTPPPAQPNIYIGDTTGLAYGRRLPNAPKYVTKQANLYIAAHIKNKDLEGAERRLLEMRTAGIRGDHKTYELMMKAYARNQKFDDLWRMFKELKGVELKMLRPTYTLMLDTMSRSTQEEKMLEIFEEMKNSRDPFHKPYVRSYNTMLHFYMRKEHVARVEEILKEMQDHSVSPNSRTYSTLLQTYAKEKDVERVLELVDEMRLAMIQPNAKCFQTLIDLFSDEELDHPDKEDLVGTLERQRAMHMRRATFKEWYPEESRQQFIPTFQKYKKGGRKNYY